MSPVEAGFEQQVTQGPNGLHWQGGRPLGYAETTPATTTSKVPPVASPGAKALYAELIELVDSNDDLNMLSGILSVMAAHDPRDTTDLRWAWKVEASLE